MRHSQTDDESSARALHRAVLTLTLSLSTAMWSTHASAAAQLGIAGAQGSNTLGASSDSVYVINLSNLGNVATGTFTVTATVPSYTSVSSGQAPGAYCSGTWPCQPGQNIYWIDQNLASGQSEALQFSATLPATAPADGTVTSTTINTTLTDSPSIALNTTVRSAKGVSVSLSCAPANIGSNRNFACSLDYGNAGAAAAGAVLTLSFPSALTASNSTGGASISSGAATWALGSLAHGSSGSQTVQLAVPTTLSAGTLLPISAKLQAASGIPSGSGFIGVAGASDMLQISATASPDSVLPGAPVAVAISLINTNTSSTGTFTLYASVPSNTSVASGQAPGAYCSGTWPCQPGDYVYWIDQNLASGQAENLQFSATVNSGSLAPAAGTVLNSIITGEGGFESASTTAESVVESSGSPAVGISASPNATSSSLTYTINYANGATAADAAVLTMAIPPGTSFNSASAAGVLDAGVVTWTLGKLSPGQAGSQQLTVAGPAAASLVPGEAQLLKSASSEVTYGRASTATTIGASDALWISAVASPDAVLPGQPLTMLINLLNTNANSTGTFTIYAGVPNNTAVASGQAPGAYCSGTWPCQPGDYLYWIDQNLASGQSETVQFSALVNSGSIAPVEGTFLNSIVTTEGGVEAAVMTARVVVGSTGAPALTLSAPQQVAADATYNYVLTYGNSGAAVEGAVLTMPIPPGATFVSASSGGKLTNGVVNWTLASIAAGGAGTEQLTVAAPTTAGMVIAEGQLLTKKTADSSYGRATTATVVGADDGLRVAANASPDAVSPGQPLTVNIQALNSNPAGTGTFTIYAGVPNDSTVASGQAPGAYCSGTWPCQPGDYLYWIDQNLASGQSETLQFSATVNSGSSAPPVGTVLLSEVTGSGGTESASASAQAIVGAAGPALQLSAPSQAAINAAYSYTLSYANSGTAAVPAVLNMALPNGATFVSASSGGKLAAGVVSWSLGTLAAGEAGTRTFTVKASAAPSVINGDAQLVATKTSPLSYARASTATTVDSSDGLQISVGTTPDPVPPGQPLTFTPKVLNLSASSTGTFTVYASVPDNTSVPNTQAPGAYCSGTWPCQPGYYLYWIDQNLASAQSASYEFSANVNGGALAPPTGTVISSVVTALGGFESGLGVGLSITGP